MKITQEQNSLRIESTRFTARFEGAALVSLVDRPSGSEFLHAGPTAALSLCYLDGSELAKDKNERVEVKLLSDLAARVLVLGHDSDRELLIRLDPATGDLCVRPAGQSARRGLLSVRWSLDFVRCARLILPCVNGIQVDADRRFPGNDRFQWPFRWNAQLVIAQNGHNSLMLHAEDTACKFKALQLARQDDGLTRLGFESEQVGPVWDNRNAGGVEWRLNTYDGDWRTPAGRYHGWLGKSYQLGLMRHHRPEWVEDIGFSAQWVSANPAFLDALAELYPPERTLIHLADWRTSKYDVDYPDYVPSADARAFLTKANAMGFKVLPHFNFFACYNDHPVFKELRDWQLRNVNRNEPEGWYWPPDTHDYTRMAYIHPGLAKWRRILIDNLRAACRDVNAAGAFIDQTLCTWNTDNGLVENLTTVEGLRQLQEEICQIDPHFVLAGEGLNEISFQRECFAQGHIHDGWGKLEDRHVQAAHNVCAFLWGGHSRLMGYYHLLPDSDDAWTGQMELGIEVYRRMGAIPSIEECGQFAKHPERFAKTQPLIKRVLDLAQ